MGKINVVAVTTSRADYGLLKWPLKAMAGAPDFDLNILVSGSHLAPGHGETITEILGDGFTPAEQIDILLDGSSDAAIATGMGLGLIQFAKAYERLKPDFVLLLGDRFEALSAAAAALVSRVPICHLCGGDVTEGAYDDSIRHAISKMAHLHCVTSDAARTRLLQLGEEPWRIHVTGSPGLDALNHIPTLTRDDVFKRIGLKPQNRNYLVTYHPVTLASQDESSGDHGICGLLNALDGLGQDVGLVFTGVNADSGAAEIRTKIETFVGQHANAVSVDSLGQTLYLNAVRQMTAVVGNSSSGLYEVPSLEVPTVNIGDRQKGRLRATSVIDCAEDSQSITEAINAAGRKNLSGVANPYGNGNASQQIVDAIRAIGVKRHEILRKVFVDLID